MTDMQVAAISALGDKILIVAISARAGCRREAGGVASRLPVRSWGGWDRGGMDWRVGWEGLRSVPPPRTKAPAETTT